MRSRLLLIEGIPGSGKTTIAGKAADHLRAKGMPVTLYTEGNPHPADMAWHAWIPLPALERVLAPFAPIRDEINRHMWVEGGYAILAYTKVETEDPAFFEQMAEYEVYNARVPPEVFDGLLETRWEMFGLKAARENTVHIFESAFLQNHVTELLHFRQAPKLIISEHCGQLLRAVAQLDPVVIYLSQPDVEETIARVARERVSPYGNWADALVAFTEGTPYGKQNGLQGMEGAISAIKMRRAIENAILPRLPATVWRIENPHYDWDAVWAEVAEKLDEALQSQ